MAAHACSTPLEPKAEPFQRRRFVHPAGFDLALGKTALAVWRRLVFLRGLRPDGLVHATERGIMMQLPVVSCAAVKKAMKRLVELGVVVPVGWRVLEVKVGGKTALRSVFCRRVYGEELPKKDLFSIVGGGKQRMYQVTGLPPEVVLKIRDAPRWGGKRAGAGRPRKAAPGFQEAPGPGNQEAPRVKEEALEATTKATDSFSSTKKKASADGAGAARLSVLQEEAGEAGDGIGPAKALVPPAPWNVEGLEPPVVPAPPLLPARPDPDGDARALLLAYQGVVGALTGRPCLLLAGRGQLEGSAEFDRLVRCAAALREEGIAPVAWAKWSASAWARPGTAPLRWVFSAQRVVDEAGWFGEDAERMGGRVVYGPSHTELIRRHAQMSLAVRHAQMSRSGKEKAYVEYCFPAGLYEDLVAKAKAECSEAKEHLARRIARGEYVWDLPHAGGKTSAVN